MSGWTPAALVEALAARGAAPAVTEMGGEATDAAGLVALSLGAARALAEAGVGRGDAVALHAANGAGWIAAGRGCGWLGAVLVPLDAALAPAEARRLAAEAGAKLLIADEEGGEGPPVLRLGAIAPAERAEAPAAAELDPEAPLALFRTSGTTGAPKPFHLSLRNIAFNVEATVAAGLVGSDDRVLMPLPMHHIFPWVIGVLVGLQAGCALVLPETATGPDLARALREGRPTVLIGVPKLFEALLDGVRERLGAPLRAVLRGAVRLRRATGVAVGPLLFAPVRRRAAPGLRLMISGGARLDPETAEVLEALGWQVRSGYGLSETAAVFAAHFGERRPGTEGRPLEGCEIRIDRPNAEGVGEILLRGPNVFDGYLDNPEANARAFTEDGWFRSGDLGRLDRDGFLVVAIRAKEVIVLGGGENVYPEDLERAYGAAEDVAEIAALEHEGGLHALVAPDLGALGRRGATRAEDAVRVALSLVGRDLPSTWRLAGFRLTRGPLPRTRLGKLRRFLLPELYEQDGSGAAPAQAEPPTEAERARISEEPRASVWALLARRFPDRRLGLETHLGLDLGLDSFAWMSLAVEIEEACGVRLEARDIVGIATVRELLEAVSEKATGPRDDPAEARAARLAEGRRWIGPRGVGARASAAAIHGLNRVWKRLAYRLEATGAEGLPAEGPLLICPSHASDLDPPAMAAALPWRLLRRTAWAADEVRVFGVPAHRAVCRPLRVFPVSEVDPGAAVALAAEVLGRGEVQVWFPEGWRSADGRLLRFQAGVGRVIAEAQAPVVPVFIEGAREVWPRDRRMPRATGRVRVHFGAPVPATELAPGGDLDAARPEEIAEALRDRVGALARSRGAEVL